jgi:hypothetical protein
MGQLEHLEEDLAAMASEALWSLWWWIDEVLIGAEGELGGEALVWAQRVARVVQLELGVRLQMDVEPAPLRAVPAPAPTEPTNVVQVARGQVDVQATQEAQSPAAPFGISLSLDMLQAIHQSQVLEGEERQRAVVKAHKLATDPAHFWLVLMLPQEDTQNEQS